MKTQQKTRGKLGGARPGAGRPPSAEPRISVGLRLTDANRHWLETEAARLDCSMSDVVNRLIAAERQ